MPKFNKSDALHYLGINVKQILMFGDGGCFVHEPAESVKFVQIVQAVVTKADAESVLKKLMKSVKKRDECRMFSSDGKQMTLYDFFVALKSSDTCGMMAQGILEGYIKEIKGLHEMVV
jgi:hypothetical protein